MGLIQSCIGNRSNKVDVMSEEEAEAYSKMEDEIKKGLVEDYIQTKSLPWMMFCTESIVKQPYADEVTNCPILGVVQKKGGVAFDIRYKSTVPKLPPIKIKRIQVPSEDKDYEEWKTERVKLLFDKHEKATIRRERIIQQQKRNCMSTRRPIKAARSTYVIESTLPMD